MDKSSMVYLYSGRLQSSEMRCSAPVQKKEMKPQAWCQVEEARHRSPYGEVAFTWSQVEATLSGLREVRLVFTPRVTRSLLKCTDNVCYLELLQTVICQNSLCSLRIEFVNLIKK